MFCRATPPSVFNWTSAGPRDIEISLPGSTLDADLPEKGQKGLIGTLTGSRSNGTLILRLRTTQPGVTILPMYDAATRRLSVELGGQPGRAVDVPQPKATAERSGPGPAVAAEKVPLDRAAEPVTPPVQQTPQAAKTEEKLRQNELMPAQEKPVPNIKAIRLASKPTYTRLVVQGDAPVEAEYEQEGRIGWLRMQRGGLMPGAAFDEADGRVSSIGVIRRKPLLLRIEFKDEPQRHRLFYAIGGRAAVLDVDLGGPRPSPTPDARQIPKRAEPEQPGSVARGAIPQAPGPGTRSTATSAPMPTPPAEEVKPAPKATAAAMSSAMPTATATPRPSQRFADRAAQLVHETPGVRGGGPGEQARALCGQGPDSIVAHPSGPGPAPDA